MQRDRLPLVPTHRIKSKVVLELVLCGFSGAVQVSCLRLRFGTLSTTLGASKSWYRTIIVSYCRYGDEHSEVDQDEVFMAKQRVEGGARRNTGYNSPHIDTEYSDNRILHIEVVW
jgi:hypothetical protein